MFPILVFASKLFPLIFKAEFIAIISNTVYTTFASKIYF